MVESESGRIDDLVDRVRGLEKQADVDEHLIVELQQKGARDQAKIANLEVALVSSRRIGAAVGILMERNKITEEQAFAILAQISHNSQRKLRVVADELVSTGVLPSA